MSGGCITSADALNESYMHVPAVAATAHAVASAALHLAKWPLYYHALREQCLVVLSYVQCLVIFSSQSGLAL